ncbi:uncharacterized protein M421DRAFT_419317 [Didymella exigua CBS 183.55]|uniref:Uncharacterized protein n=1 Tax=Didymella exigua CBS 183.55 TaxID=1150837 RepID=A0A6A5RW73_9PLEO|nr:uncharacterized protein M421DRAFT_419317 [Didymella exigua CBS 183.55]KAF1929527.1 hypothetical protein M421DRAFT_419317 [Didymella exigua CBS 183.55]
MVLCCLQPGALMQLAHGICWGRGRRGTGYTSSSRRAGDYLHWNGFCYLAYKCSRPGGSRGVCHRPQHTPARRRIQITIHGFAGPQSNIHFVAVLIQLVAVLDALPRLCEVVMLIASAQASGSSR